MTQRMVNRRIEGREPAPRVSGDGLLLKEVTVQGMFFISCIIPGIMF